MAKRPRWCLQSNAILQRFCTGYLSTCVRDSLINATLYIVGTGSRGAPCSFRCAGFYSCLACATTSDQTWTFSTQEGEAIGPSTATPTHKQKAQHVPKRCDDRVCGGTQKALRVSCSARSLCRVIKYRGACLGNVARFISAILLRC